MSEDLQDQLTAEERLREIRALYRQAFAEHGVRALWYLREVELPTVEQALRITRSLRIEGNMDARRLAERIERLGRADQ